MKQRWNANTWALAVLSGLVLVIGGETLRTYLAGDRAAVEDAKKQMTAMDPPFKKGEKAPDFTLTDGKGKKQELASLVSRTKQDTLLCFICGCNNCRSMQKYIDVLKSKLGANAPQVVSVSTMQPGAEPGYRKDVKLDQTLLYEEKPDAGKTSIMDIYKGHPCPRIYRLRPDRTVEWIGPSMKSVPIPAMGIQLAEDLGFRTLGGKDLTKPLAPDPPDPDGMIPKPKKESQATPPRGSTQAASAHTH